jgi:hypothetical protein
MGPEVNLMIGVLFSCLVIPLVFDTIGKIK